MRDAVSVLFAAVLAAPLLLGQPACNTLWGVDELDYAAATAGGAAGAGTGGAGGDTTSSGTGGQQVCEHAVVPERPASTSVDQGDPLVFAIKTITLSGEALGLDLDGTCTCQGEEPSCQPASPDQNLCDGPAGRDNAAQMLLLGFEPLYSEPPDTFYTGGITTGQWSVLLLVSGYSGEADDSSVEVIWHLSAGTAEQPVWDGNDVWRVDPDSIENNLPRYVDSSAYVAAGQLVVALPKVHLLMVRDQARLPVILSEMQLLAQLSQDTNGAWSLTQGVIAGLISDKDAFDMISGLRDETGAALCMNSPIYAPCKDALCSRRDVLVSAKESNLICDGWSFGMGFEALPAEVGTVSSTPVTSGCDPSVDPSTDSCQ